jgi:Na+-transporting NADH:ubiquinone oxidoreductase subunit F
MKAIKLSRKIHKWIALALGVQLFLWALSGFYMVAVNIDIIHGDMLVKNLQRDVSYDDTLHIPLEQLAIRHPDARSITLKSMMGRPVYQITGESSQLLDAKNGRHLSPLDAQTATQIASYHYAGEGTVGRVEFIESDPPTELQARSLPLWRVDFDDVWNSSFYIDPHTGEFTTRRHSLWRVFDFLWMLHVMDYDERSDINNTVLRVFSVLGTFLGLTGVWMLYFSFKRNRDQEPAL